MNQLCHGTAKKADIVLGSGKRNAACETDEVILPIYLSLARPQLVYYVESGALH